MAHTSRLGQNIGENKFSHTGVSPKWVKSKMRREKERRGLNYGNNNGQLRIANVTSCGAHKAAWAKTKPECFSEKLGLGLRTPTQESTNGLNKGLTLD